MRFDLTSKKIPMTAPQKLIAKLFGQQPVVIYLRFPAAGAGKITIGGMDISRAAGIGGLW